MMGLKFLSDETAVPLGSMKAFDVDGEKILLIHLEEGFFATQAKCPHLSMPLEKGKLFDDHKLRCKFHRAEFDVRNGRVCQWANFPPGIQALNFFRAEKDLRMYTTKREDGRVYVEV